MPAAEPRSARPGRSLGAMTISVAVSGATGRLGGAIAELVRHAPDLELAAELSSRSDLAEMDGADVLIDATRLEASERAVDHALDAGLDVVVGTSGWDRSRLDALAARIPAGRGVLVIPNFSIGSVLATHLATIAARWYESIEIVEAHHDRKADAPSGTAVRTAERLAEGRAAAGLAVPSAPTPDQPGRGAIVAGIPVHAMRLRGVTAEQRVLLGGEGELVEVRHETFSNTAYERGILLALRAAPETTGLVVGLDRLLDLDGGPR